MTRPRVALIAAMDRQRVIGRRNRLPWHLPNDLKRFKALTLGHPVLMGRKTWESLACPLPGRRNLVLSRNAGFQAAGAEVYPDPASALAAAADCRMLFVIGGEEIYRIFLPRADELFLTQVHAEIEGGDAHFPEFPPGAFLEICRIPHPKDDRHAYAYDFVEYEKIH